MDEKHNTSGGDLAKDMEAKKLAIIAASNIAAAFISRGMVPRLPDKIREGAGAEITTPVIETMGLIYKDMFPYVYAVLYEK